MRVLVGAAAAAVAVVLVLVLIGGGRDDEGGDGGEQAGGADTVYTIPGGQQTNTTIDRARREEFGLTPASRRAREAGANAVRNVYGGIDQAIDDGIVPVDVDPRRGLAEAADNKALADICALMSRKAQRQTVDFAESSARLSDVEWDCPTAIALLIRYARQAGKVDKVVGVKVIGAVVKGNRGTATLDLGGGATSTIPLVKEDGRWKIAAAPTS